MIELTLETAPKPARDLFNKGFAALERGNLDYAIDMLTRSVEAAPGLVRGWRFLRAAEIRRFREQKAGRIAKTIAAGLRMPGHIKASALLRRGKFEAALFASEALLREAPLDLRFVKLFSEAAVALDLPGVARLTFEALHENDPRDPDILDGLGTLYLEIGKAREARDCFEKLTVLRPHDADIVKKLKDAMALDSMGGWDSAVDSGATFHEMLKDEDEAVKLERQNKFVRTGRDSEALIKDLEAQIAAEPANVNYYRNLAKLLIEAERHEEAATVLRNAVELNPGDVELDAALSRVRVLHFDYKIRVAREAGDETAAQAAENERLHFVFEDLQNRVERYPNDLDLRFEWGRMLYKNDHFNEAIQQFQKAQRNPRNRVRALYYLGLCFKAKGQYDMAVDQLEQASGEIPGMDALKKDVLYELGSVCELRGDTEKAGTVFKQIYQADIGYRDVAAKVEQNYS
jgi:tetratricopeptide (TPR) repeat protein